MEIKSKIKDILKNPLQIIAIILSIAIISFIIINSLNYLKRFNFKITVALAILLLIGMGIFILYKYIYTIFKMFKKKKVITPILMILLVILLTVGIFYIECNVNYILKNSIILLIYILGVICIPMIILVFSIINPSKYNKIRIAVSLLLLIYIYTINMEFLVISAKMIITNLSNHSIYELLEKEDEDDNVNLTYLEDYAQKFAKNGYLNKYDITQILDLTDKKSKEMTIYYQDEKSNINIETTNKNDEEMENLKNTLKAEYYKYYYEKDEKKQIKIYIERYSLEQNLNQEKNENIVLKGTKNTEIVENVNKYGTDKNSNSFCFTNKIQVNSNDVQEIKKFNLLFVYDQDTQNYVPVIENVQECAFIESYKVYNTGIEITLNKGVQLTNTEYTLKINRYNDELKIRDREITNNAYYYDYEPVVTKMEGYENRIVLEMRFDRSYTIEELKNIEIIFGNY